MAANLEKPESQRGRMVDCLSPLRGTPVHPIRPDFPGQAHEAHDAGSKRVMDCSGISIEPCPTIEPKRSGPMCAFTVDVEDWYQSSVDFDAPITERVVRNCENLLGLLDQRGIKGTFSSRAWLRKRSRVWCGPSFSQGHEVQSHGTVTDHCTK